MAELTASPFFGIALSIVAFWIGVKIQKKTGLTACNPLLIAIVLVIGVLLLFHISYEDYDQGGSLINLFLSPATACLAVAIYGKLRILKHNWLPILVGCCVGSAVSMGSVFLLCRLFGLDAAMTASLLAVSPSREIEKGSISATAACTQSKYFFARFGGQVNPGRPRRRSSSVT